MDRTCAQKDQLKMVVTPITAKQEEKIGTTCHQCRQKIKGLSAHCTNKKNGKPCPNKFCHKCLINRYGEQAEEKSVLKEWNCPKCRGICNCSVCMKRRGQEPTGKLGHTAKVNGFSSVSELKNDEGPKRAIVLNKYSIEADEGTKASDAYSNEPSDGLLQKPEKGKKKKRKLTELNELEDFSMPRGTEMTSVAGVKLPPEDVGHALQFLEFCTAFNAVLDLKVGEPICILHELIRGGNGCQGKQSPVIHFHIVLLSIIHKDLKKDGKGSSWLQALQNCLSKSQDLLEKLELDGINLEVDEYESLSSSTRLRILTFLCDEVLCTGKYKRWIDDQNAKFAENQKLSKERIQAAKKKKKDLKLKLKMQGEVGKAVTNNGDISLDSVHEAVVSELKNEITKAHAEVIEAKNKATDEKRSYEAARTKNLISDIDGHTYWRLKGYADDSNIFLQDAETWDGSVYSEKWFTIDVEQAKEVEEHIHSLSERKIEASATQVHMCYKTGRDIVIEAAFS